MESYDISVDVQSNFAYYEYYLGVLVAFLINSYIEYGAWGQTKKKCTKVPASLQPVFSDMVCYQSDDWIWYTNQLWTDFHGAECTHYALVDSELMGVIV